MNIQGNHSFAAPPWVVFDLLLDPDALRASMPGCESLTPVSDSRFDLHMKVPVPAVMGEYTGTVTIVERDAPNRVRMQIDASGKSGFVNADAVMVLRPDGDATVVEYSAEAQLGGPAAAVGQRVITGISRHQIATMMKALEEYAADQAAKVPTPPAPVQTRLGVWRRLLLLLRGRRAPS